MINSKAKEYLQSCKYEIEDYSGNLSYLVPIEDAEKAIELTEEEMVKKAEDAFCIFICSNRSFPCFGNRKFCKMFNEFKQKLMKQ